MRLHRIYYEFEAQIGSNINITDERAHYLRNVLRLKKDHKIRIFNHFSQEYLAKIISINKKEVVVNLIESITPIAQSKLDITLVQSISKGERMDYSIQKATELGVNTILPITSEYCEVRLKGTRLEKKMNHWRNISISACEQSFRADIPQILEPLSLTEYCKNKSKGILLEPEEKNTIQSIAQFKWKQFDIAVGPEGGWSERDLNQLKSTRLQGIQFGARILRTETVAPAILAAIHSLWGDFVI